MKLENSTIKKADVREYGVEILRVLLMIFIVAHHTIVHGFGFIKLQNGSWDGNNTLLLTFMNALFVVAVNVFFIISGYFGIKRTKKRIITLHWQQVIHILISFAIVFAFSRGGVNEALKALLLPEYHYWFMFVYLLMVCVSPYIEMVIERINKKEHLKIIVCAFIVIGIFDFLLGMPTLGFEKGYSFSNALFMYIIGTYLRKYIVVDRNKRIKATIIYIFLTICTGEIAVLLIEKGHQSLAWNMFSYSSPIIILAAVALFVVFANLRDENIYRKIRFISKGVLSAYLLTEFSPMREIVYMPAIKITAKIGPCLAIISYSVFLVLSCSLAYVVVDKVFDGIWLAIGRCKKKYDL